MSTISRDGHACTRRDFLRWSWSLGAGLVLPAGLAGCGGGSGGEAPPPLPGETFVEPPTLSSSNGVLDVTLTVAYVDTRLDGKSVRLRTMAGSIPAPTLRVEAGDVLRILLENRLPPNPPSAEPVRHLRYPNSTNLHTHGLHVTPGLVSAGVYGDFVMDDPALGVQPGQSRRHEFRIGRDHPPGACWYHPHLHGATAIQVGSGMAGALIVRGSVDGVPEIAAARERVFMFQAPISDNAGVLESFTQVADRPSNELSFLVNGVRRPKLVMRRGEVQNWRFVHAGIFNMLNLALDGHDLHVHGHDGCPRANLLMVDAESAEGLVLAPGNRASVLVQAGAPGTYYLRTVGYLEDILAEVEVIDESRPMRLPSGPLPVPPLLAPITDDELASGGGLQRHLVLRQVFNPNGDTVTLPPANAVVHPGGEIDDWVFQTGNTTLADSVFAIGAAGGGASPAGAMPDEFIPFQSTRAVKQAVALGSVEEWTVFNMNGIGHPFHLHVNPFQVTRINGVRIDPYWADTIALPPGGTPEEPTSVTLRVRFLNFRGTFVMHCHMVAHEDMGMMQVVEVV
jgi:FtsP/CotA-like multicopper oxidase with cupredoxin domain